MLLDVIIVRKYPGTFTEPMPEGLEDLAAHNLITFKSHHEALDDWALKELTGHYVNYRKQVSPSLQQLLPEAEFRLYAVCARFPQNLANQAALVEKRPGIYECRRGTDAIVVVVLRQLPQSAHNALWHLFSALPEQVAFAVDAYRLRSDETSTLLIQLFQGYKKEELAMPYTMADFRREYAKEIEEERRELAKELLKIMPPEEIVKAVSPEEIVKALSPEEIVKALSPEERLQGLSTDEIERYLRRLKAGTSSGEAASPPE